MLQMRGRHGGYGWRKDSLDPRDHWYAAPYEIVSDLAPTSDLRSGFPDCYDQSELGSCVANGVGGLTEYDWRRQKLPDFCPSRLFIYFQGRVLEHTVNEDSGLEVRDGIKVIAKYGAPHEHEWPYDISKFTTKPPRKAYTDALLRQAIQYARVQQTLQQLKACLCAGFPFTFGFMVYESFESDQVASTGLVPMPNPYREERLGGHCVVGCGHNDAERMFWVRNSWGTKWGMDGYCKMPYEYLTSTALSADFWKITLMERSTTP